MFDLTVSLPDSHSDAHVRSAGLPDSVHAEMAQAFPDTHGQYIAEEEAEMEAQYRARLATLPDLLDVPCQGCGAAIYVEPGGVPLCTACTRLAADDDGPDDAPHGGAMFPEIPTWNDQQLIVAIELADAREPGLNLHAVGNLPDRHEAFLHECSAELVRRLESRGVRLAA